MLEIEEIIRPAQQGRTTPFLCNASDGHTYFVKGYAATVGGLMKEWIGAHLAKAFGLPVPDFRIAYLEKSLADSYGGKASSELKSGYVFASKQVSCVTELKFETIKLLEDRLKLSVLLFDLWVENEDRTLSENGGNPNLLWKTDDSALFVIDHNLIFDPDFKRGSFWETHIFSSIIVNKQDDLLAKYEFEGRMQRALDNWQIALDSMPAAWLELNDELGCFEFEKHLQRLQQEALGDIWLKLP